MSKSSSKESLPAGAMETSSLDKDQMLQEKDKQIEELTRMLRQKQRLVETLRSQLEQGKMAGGVAVKEEGNEKSRTAAEVKLQTLIKASTIQPPALPNGIVLTVKEEIEQEKGMEGVTEEAQAKRLTQPMQCSQETLLRLQQIHRLQLQQAEQQKQQKGQVRVQKDSEGKTNQQQKKEAQLLLQQQQLQQLIIQQTQQKQLLAQQKQLKQTQAEVQSQRKSQVQLKQVQLQIQNQTPTSQKAALSQSQLRKQQRAQQRQQQKQQTAAASTQQVRRFNQGPDLCSNRMFGRSRISDK